MKKHIPLLVAATFAMACTFAAADQAGTESAPVKTVKAKKCKKDGQTQVFDMSTTATPGAPDTLWSQIAPSPATAIGKTPYPGWNAPLSTLNHWVQGTPGASATSAPAGTYSYAASIAVPSSPGFIYLYSLTGKWSADNTGNVYFNGTLISKCPSSTQASSLCFTYHTVFATTGTALTGLNTLQVDDVNWGGPAGALMEGELKLTCTRT